MAPREEQNSDNLQQLLTGVLPPLMNAGQHLMQTATPWNPKIAAMVFASMAQSLFLLMKAAHDNFQRHAWTGYFTTAALARSIMEKATILVMLSRDPSGNALSQLLFSAEREAQRRQNGLKRLQSSKDIGIAEAAKTEVQAAAGICKALKEVRSKSALPLSTVDFPNMADRCKSLGVGWEFEYESIYRDLCGAVHSSFGKITHAPSIALNAPDQGHALLYEHCCAIGHAMNFWGQTVLECCHNHPNQQALADFRGQLLSLSREVKSITDLILSKSGHHTISF